MKAKSLKTLIFVFSAVILTAVSVGISNFIPNKFLNTQASFNIISSCTADRTNAHINDRIKLTITHSNLGSDKGILVFSGQGDTQISASSTYASSTAFVSYSKAGSYTPQARMIYIDTNAHIHTVNCDQIHIANTQINIPDPIPQITDTSLNCTVDKNKVPVGDQIRFRGVTQENMTEYDEMEWIQLNAPSNAQPIKMDHIAGTSVKYLYKDIKFIVNKNVSSEIVWYHDGKIINKAKCPDVEFYTPLPDNPTITCNIDPTTLTQYNSFTVTGTINTNITANDKLEWIKKSPTETLELTENKQTKSIQLSQTPTTTGTIESYVQWNRDGTLIDQSTCPNVTVKERPKRPSRPTRTTTTETTDTTETDNAEQSSEDNQTTQKRPSRPDRASTTETTDKSETTTVQNTDDDDDTANQTDSGTFEQSENDPREPKTLSCFASPNLTFTGEEITWSIKIDGTKITAQNNKDYFDFIWSGDALGTEISSIRTYEESGLKTAELSLTYNGEEDFLTTRCQATILPTEEEIAQATTENNTINEQNETNTDNTANTKSAETNSTNETASNQPKIELEESKCTGIYYPIDINNHWAKDYIKQAYDECIVRGFSDHTFRPNSFITRAEALKVIMLAAKVNPNAGCYDADCGSPFTDLDLWMGPWVRSAWDKKIIIANEKFHPNDLITRAAAVTMSAKAFKIQPHEGCYTPNCGAGHPDNLFIDIYRAWQGPWIRALWDKEIIEGTFPFYFEPDRPITRAELIKIVIKSKNL
ncbi:hypothetical protein GF340_01685 [Candidatus Peregrinibacteria bacterium]|nr:hypothetical protein [Candidatus Peregrinibacteria bacterium]